MPQRFRLAVAGVLALLIVFLTGRLTGSSQLLAEQKALKPYLNATLSAGKGLGGLKLGQTTLAWLVRTLGTGLVGVAVTDDEVMLELMFLNQQVSFGFLLHGECQRQTGVPMQRLDVNQDLGRFLTRYPACADLPLSSISLDAGKVARDAFYQGTTDQGVKLGSPFMEVFKHGQNLEHGGPLVTGGYSENNLERVGFRGIAFFYDAGEQPTAEEVLSGRPLPPERLRQLEQSRLEAAKNRVVQRITVFIPQE
jgi:hypothetical protein